jgi:hypothetical protein
MTFLLARASMEMEFTARYVLLHSSYQEMNKKWQIIDGPLLIQDRVRFLAPARYLSCKNRPIKTMFKTWRLRGAGTLVCSTALCWSAWAPHLSMTTSPTRNSSRLSHPRAFGRPALIGVEKSTRRVPGCALPEQPEAACARLRHLRER